MRNLHISYCVWGGCNRATNDLETEATPPQCPCSSFLQVAPSSVPKNIPLPLPTISEQEMQKSTQEDTGQRCHLQPKNRDLRRDPLSDTPVLWATVTPPMELHYGNLSKLAPLTLCHPGGHISRVQLDSVHCASLPGSPKGNQPMPWDILVPIATHMLSPLVLCWLCMFLLTNRSLPSTLDLGNYQCLRAGNGIGWNSSAFQGWPPSSSLAVQWQLGCHSRGSQYRAGTPQASKSSPI